MIRVVASVILILAAALAYRLEAQRQTSARGLLERRLELAERENNRLRALVSQQERDDAQAKNREWRQKIERDVEEIRGLKFKRPVEYEIVTREQIKNVLSGKLTELMTEAEFTNIARALSRLGLVPEGYPLRQSYLDLLSEQVAAFYDQHRGKLVMFADASLENGQNRIILAHELTHALQDQHFGLLKLPLEIKDNDDRALAASSLVEGEATLVMTQYQMKNLSLQALRETVSATFGQSMAQLEKAPRYLRELLVFPYLRGQEFCAALSAHGGYAKISAAYARLPASTAEILHPEQYLARQGDGPPEVFSGPLAYQGEEPALSNTLGEIGTRLQLTAGGDDLRAEEAAAGWRGDRYLYFAKADALVWKTMWANAPEAAEFASAERLALRAHYGLRDPKEDGVTFAADAPRAIRLVQAGDGVVLLVDATTAETAEGLVGQFGKR